MGGVIPGQPINTRTGPYVGPTAPPNPARPAAPTAIGTSDNPVLPGQKPGVAAAPVPAQPQKRQRLPWWEEDWAATTRATRAQRNRLEVLAEDTGKPAPVPVEEMAYSDVIDPNNHQLGLQGPQLRASLTDREGEPMLRAYIESSQDAFPLPRLLDVYGNVQPKNPREAVPVGFEHFGPVVAYPNVQTNFK